MIEIYQTDFTKETGNCLQACVASLLHLNLEEVPSFKAINQRNPVGVMSEWVSCGYNLVAVKSLWNCTHGTFCIAAVPSERHKGKYHAVVARIGRSGKPRLYHDPNPDSKLKKGRVLRNWNALYFLFLGFNTYGSR